MLFLKRDLICDEKIKAGNDNIDNLPYCQASFNSDNCIVLRNYDKRNKSKDEIIMLSPTETEAIFTLFSRLGVKIRNNTLPF